MCPDHKMFCSEHNDWKIILFSSPENNINSTETLSFPRLNPPVYGFTSFLFYFCPILWWCDCIWFEKTFSFPPFPNIPNTDLSLIVCCVFLKTTNNLSKLTFPALCYSLCVFIELLLSTLFKNRWIEMSPLKLLTAHQNHFLPLTESTHTCFLCQLSPYLSSWILHSGGAEVA